METVPVAIIPDATPTPVSGSQLPPVVVDLGKTKKKLIRELKHGEGKLMEDVKEAVEAVRSNLPEMEGKELIPIVIIYERKTPRRGGILPFAF